MMDTPEELFAWIQSQGEARNEEQAKRMVLEVYKRGFAHGEESMLGIAAEWRECYEAAVAELNALKAQLQATC